MYSQSGRHAAGNRNTCPKAQKQVYLTICREGRAEGTPRDAFLRPMVDLKGAKDRLGFDAKRAAMEIEDEFDENRWESQEAIKYGSEASDFPAFKVLPKSHTLHPIHIPCKACSFSSGLVLSCIQYICLCAYCMNPSDKPAKSKN